jgi:hypothetical protein
MKGSIEELTWAFVQVAIVLVFVAWAVTPLYKNIEQAQQNSARLNAQEIAGVINTMKASPADMKYRAFLPSSTCTIEINSKFVKFDLSAGGRRHVVTMDIIQTPVAVSGGTFECAKRSITIEKRGAVIQVN